MKKISVDYFNLLLQEEESEHLDFKEIHHKNNADLVHDILCLLNSECNSDRFIIFGITDNKEIKGISGERKKQAEIADCIRNSNFNRNPSFLLYEIKHNNLTFDILHIKNTPYKPYFLLKDKKEGNTTIRAGVVYTRNNDSNTPKDRTASLNQIEAMWRERFGLDRSPLDRVYKYIHNLSGWKKAKETEAFYELFPEFRIVWKSEEPRTNFYEHWNEKKATTNLSNASAQILYHTTLLFEVNLINLDDHIFFPIPRYYNLQKVHEDGKAYIINKHLESYICGIIDDNTDINEYDKEYILEEKIKEPIDSYLCSLKEMFEIYSLNIKLEDENVNRQYNSKDQALLKLFKYEDMTFTDEEIDVFLPKELKRCK